MALPTPLSLRAKTLSLLDDIGLVSSESHLPGIARSFVDHCFATNFCHPNDAVTDENEVEDGAAQPPCEPSTSPLLFESAETAISRLELLSELLREWQSRASESAAASASPSKSTLADGHHELWTLLASHHSCHKMVLAWVHHCVSRAQVLGKTMSDLEVAVAAGVAYTALLSIPGATAFGVFHPLLFRSVLDLVKLWPAESKQTNASSTKRKASEAAPRSRSKRARRQMDEDADDGTDVEPSGSVGMDVDSQNDSDDESEEGSLATNELGTKRGIQLLYRLLENLVSVLARVPLSSAADTHAYCAEMLCNLTRTRCESESDLVQFGALPSRSASVAQHAYNGLIHLCYPIHGPSSASTLTVLRHLLPNILMSYALPLPATISKAMGAVHQNAVNFTLFALSNSSSSSAAEDISKAVYVFMQHICNKAPDRAEYRSRAAEAAAHLCLKLSRPSRIQFVNWMSKFSKTTKVANRLLALDFFLQFGLNHEQVHTADQDASTFALSNLYSLTALISRVSDKIASVRAKALASIAVFLSNAAERGRHGSGCLLLAVQSVLTGGSERTVFLDLSADSMISTVDDNNATKDVLGHFPHRNLPSILRKRTTDEKSNVRKAAVQLLEQVLCLEFPGEQKARVSQDDFQALHDRCMDPALLVRKQAVASITAVLKSHFENTQLHQVWLDAVLPLIIDKESSIQDRCAEAAKEVLLDTLEASSISTNLWSLLSKLHAGAQDSSRYLSRIAASWSKGSCISRKSVSALMRRIQEHPEEQGAWSLLVAIGSQAAHMIETSFPLRCWDQIKPTEKSIDAVHSQICALQLVGLVASRLSTAEQSALTKECFALVSSFSVGPEMIAALMQTLSKLQSCPDASSTMSDISRNLIASCELFLTRHVLSLKADEELDADAVTCGIFTLGECCQYYSKGTLQISRRLELITHTLIAPSFTPEGTDKDVVISPHLRAHAYVTLGKLCLRNESLAKMSIAAMARELETSDSDIIRNNVVVVMCDLCVRYTALVDRYIPNIAACLRDPSPLVRRQTITLLTRLLQEDFVKWKGSLFFRFVVALVDTEATVCQYADFCLSGMLLVRHPTMFFSHFMECVFHFNAYTGHSVYNVFSQTDRERSLFKLSGDENFEKRMTIYKALLEHMSDDQKFQITSKLCQEVLGGVVDEAIPTDKDGAAVIKDALAILCCKEIKLSALRKRLAPGEEDDDDLLAGMGGSGAAGNGALADSGAASQASAAVANAKTRLITQIVKKNMIENIIPIIVSLKRLFESQRSPLQRDLMGFLRDVLRDFKDEVGDIMAADRQLAAEIEFDIRKFEEQQEEAQQQQQQRQQQVPQSVTRPVLTPLRAGLIAGEAERQQQSLFVSPRSNTKLSPSNVMIQVASPLFTIPRLRQSQRIMSTPLDAASASAPSPARLSILQNASKVMPREMSGNALSSDSIATPLKSAGNAAPPATTPRLRKLRDDMDMLCMKSPDEGDDAAGAKKTMWNVSSPVINLQSAPVKRSASDSPTGHSPAASKARLIREKPVVTIRPLQF